MTTMPYDTGTPDDCWTDPDYAVSPGPVSPDVSRPVTSAVSPGVTPDVSPPGNGDDDGEGNDDLRSPGRLSIGNWETVPGEPAVTAHGFRLRGHLEALAGSEMAGGGPGGLLGELASPSPETMRQHWRHVTAHPALEKIDGPWAAAAFTAGHLAVTAPVKATGKALVLLGTALVFTGTRIDWAGDRFARIFTVLAITGALAVIILAFG